MAVEEYLAKPSPWHSIPNVYNKLDPSKKEIRLLKLDPASDFGNNKGWITCSLETAFLEQSPDFDALSYTWGSPKPTATIKLNGKKIRIRSNLYDVLKNFGFDFKYLWVDALCIHQNDLSERGH